MFHITSVHYPCLLVRLLVTAPPGSTYLIMSLIGFINEVLILALASVRDLVLFTPLLFFKVYFLEVFISLIG